MAGPGPVFDGVIAGAGAAGLLAALRAADRGATVALLDSFTGQQSNLWASSGLFSAAGTRFQRAAGVEDGPARWAGDIRRKTQGAVDPVILDSVTGRSADVAHFLADRVGLALHLNTGLVLPGHTAPRLHSTAQGSGRELAALLLAAVERQPAITVLTQTEATALLVEDGAVRGLRTRSGEAVRGRHVLLATGGFASNAAMIARHAPEILGAVNIGRGANDGWALEQGAALGGETLLMDSYQGQGHTTPDGSGRLGPGLTSYGAVVVNSLGQRFADESMGPSEFGACVLAQPGRCAVELFDRRIHEQALGLSTYRAVYASGAIVEAETLAGIAAAFGVPPAALERTMAAHRASVAGAPDAFGRRLALHALAPPFMAARVTGALVHTQGGLRVDAAARVLRPDGSAIAGLLAAGGAAASISGHGAAGYLPGNGLGQAFALGLIAAETIAAGTIAGKTAAGIAAFRAPT
ncbi:MAG: FAD-dependent oxidoreductase [Janthinobacterium lividum]